MPATFLYEDVGPQPMHQAFGDGIQPGIAQDGVDQQPIALTLARTEMQLGCSCDAQLHAQRDCSKPHSISPSSWTSGQSQEANGLQRQPSGDHDGVKGCDRDAQISSEGGCVTSQACLERGLGGNQGADDGRCKERRW